MFKQGKKENPTGAHDLLKQPLRYLWKSYVAWTVRHPTLALPLPKQVGENRWVWVHPYYLRGNWLCDGKEIYGTLNRLLELGKVFFDIGANIGQVCLVGSDWVGSGGKVVAFEPSAPNVQMLKYHIRWNRSHNVTIESMCVGATDGEVEFSLLNDGLDSSNSMTFCRKSNVPELHKRSRNIVVPITTIDAYCRRTGLLPDVMKIDVEGAEYDVLMGAKEVLKNKKPTLIMGVHPFWWPDGQAPSAINDLLRECEYRVTTLRGHDALPDAYADYVCIPRRRRAAR